MKSGKVLGLLILSLSAVIILSFLAFNAESQSPAPSPSRSPTPQPTCTPVNTGLGRDPSAPPPDNTPMIRGDTNKDGAVTQADITAITSYVNGNKAALRSFEPADVNNDNKINAADITYLTNYLSARGPQPALPFPSPAYMTPYYCPNTPCNALFNGKIVKYAAQKLSGGTTSEIWEGSAINTANNNAFVQFRIEATYSPSTDTFKMTALRTADPFGSANIPSAIDTITKPATYHYVNNVAVRDQIYGTTAVKILDGLINAEGPYVAPAGTLSKAAPGAKIGEPGTGNQKQGRCPNGCSGPCNFPPYLNPCTDAQNSCCNAHDICYAMGGTEETRQACDATLEACLNSVTPTVCKVVSNLPLPLPYEPIADSIRDGSGAKPYFRYTPADEACTCFADPTGDPQACAYGSSGKKQAAKGDGSVTRACGSPPCTNCTVSYPQPNGSTYERTYGCGCAPGKKCSSPSPTPHP